MVGPSAKVEINKGEHLEMVRILGVQGDVQVS